MNHIVVGLREASILYSTKLWYTSYDMLCIVTFYYVVEFYYYLAHFLDIDNHLQAFLELFRELFFPCAGLSSVLLLSSILSKVPLYPSSLSRVLSLPLGLS